MQYNQMDLWTLLIGKTKMADGFIKEVKKDKDGNVIQYKTIEGNANSNSAEAATVDEFTRTYDTKNGYRIDTHIYGFIDVGFYFK